MGAGDGVGVGAGAGAGDGAAQPTVNTSNEMRKIISPFIFVLLGTDRSVFVSVLD